MPHHNLTVFAAALMAFVIMPVAFASAARAGESGAAAAMAADNLSARDAGARYGQALGVVEICHGSKVTEVGNALGQKFTGPDQEIFKAQAAKIYDAWHKVKNCSKALDPNECKIIMDKSCAAAEDEIGAAGKVMPGLVEFMKR